MAEGVEILDGRLSIQAALESGSRNFQKILIHDRKKFDHQYTQLRKIAESQGIPVEYSSDEEMLAIAPMNKHSSIIAMAGPRHWVALNELLDPLRTPFVVMLDGVEDPYNLGYATRSLYAAGVQGLVLPKRDWSRATTIVARASAGTSERMPIALVESPDEAVAFFREQRYMIAMTAKVDTATPIFDADLVVPLFILIGGERRGITRSLMAQADILLQIPYGIEFAQSMGTVAATSVIAFEVMRQRRS